MSVAETFAPVAGPELSDLDLIRWALITRHRPVARPTPTERPWQEEAACAGRPDLTDAKRGPQVLAALALCHDCPVLDQCRAWAAREEHYEGVAGGDLHPGASQPATLAAWFQRIG